MTQAPEGPRWKPFDPVTAVVWKHVCWGERGYGVEHLLVGSRNADSVLVWADERGRAHRLSYDASWNERWIFERIGISLQTEGRRKDLELTRDGSGRWSLNLEAAAGYETCFEIDLWPSPFTNTLPIRRLNLEVNASQTIKVVYIEAPELTLAVREQRYTNLGRGLFRFESLEDGFTADIRVDESGLVLHYPEMFDRLA